MTVSVRLDLNQLMTAGKDEADSILRVNKTVRLLRFTKLLKLLRLVQIKRILERYEQVLGVLHSTAGNCFEIFKLTGAIFFGECLPQPRAVVATIITFVSL